MTQWRRVDPAVENGGDVGGDIQCTDSYSVRYRPIAEPDDGQYALVTIYFYGCDTPASYGGRRWEGPPATGHWVRQQVEFLICEDPEEPGGSEVYAEYTYHDLPDSYPDAEAAKGAAWGMAQREPAIQSLDWDGRSEVN